ncbi:MAG: hypothetical protein NT010_04740 [Proteobacteria bacterium]|nr:hypothetical protein [Pseudomonadota bacterium]
MKIDKKRKSAILDSVLKPDAAHIKDLPETDALLSKNKETIDKLELSTQKSMIDRSQEKSKALSTTLKEHKQDNFIDKVELSTKKKPLALVKEKEKSASTIINQDRINTLLGVLQPETYNAKLEIIDKNIMKSQLLNIII